MTRSGAAIAALMLLALTPAHATAPDGEAFVAAFGEVCIPQRLSYKGTLALAAKLGWQPVRTGENPDYDRFISFAEALLEKEIAEDPKLYDESKGAWFTRDIDGRPHLLAVNYLLTKVLDTLGCHLYDFAATTPIDPQPVTRLLDHPVAYTTHGGDPQYAVDPAILVVTVWGPPPRLPRTGDTHLTFVPEGSSVAARTGFTGVTLKFSTSLPDRAEFQK